MKNSLSPLAFSLRLARVVLPLACACGFASCGKTGSSLEKVPLVVLMSDLGSKDASVAQMKGSLLSVNPAIQVVDLSHDVQPGNLMEASYLLDKAAASFPSGTIFVVSLDTGSAARKPILVRTQQNKYYFGPDNGIFTHVMERELADQVIELSNREYFRPGEPSRIFQGRDILGPMAAHLSAGIAPAKLGERLKEVLRLKNITASTLGNKITGQVVHIDRFGNAVTNIRADNLPPQAKGKLLKLSFKGRTVSAPFLQSYAEAPSDRTFCLINSDGEFEIGLREGNAATGLGLKAGDPLVIQN